MYRNSFTVLAFALVGVGINSQGVHAQTNEHVLNYKLDQIIRSLEKTGLRFERVEERLDRLEQRVNGNSPTPGVLYAPSVPGYLGSSSSQASTSLQLQMADAMNLLIGGQGKGYAPPMPFAPPDENEQRVLRKALEMAASGQRIPLTPQEQSILERFFQRAWDSNR